LRKTGTWEVQLEQKAPGRGNPGNLQVDEQGWGKKLGIASSREKKARRPQQPKGQQRENGTKRFGVQHLCCTHKLVVLGTGEISSGVGDHIK